MTDLTKPVRRSTAARVPHGVTPRLIVTIYPGGLLGLREHRRRKEYHLDLGTLYVQAIRQEVAEAKRERNSRRRRNRSRR